MGEFNKVTYLCGWCQKIIPLVYDDSLSYYEQLCKVREKLNEVITNTNMIPDMIKQEVQDFINSGQIEEMIEEMLTGYLQRIVVNVVVPPRGIAPAKGNGNDDTETFQRCIDYLGANGGGLLFVPDGDWMVKPLTIKNGVYIAGASVSTKITLIGGSSAGLISGTVTDCGVSSLTLSNNAAQQTVDKAVVDITCNNITLDNLVVKNGYMGVNVTVNNGALIRGIKFDTLGYGGLYVNGSNADVSVSEVTVKNVSMVSGQFGVDNHCDRAVYNHIAVYGPLPTGFSNNGASVTLKNAMIVGCDTGIFNVGDDCDFNALADGNTEIINDAGERTSYNFKGQNSQRKIGENVLNLGMTSPLMYRTPVEFNKFFNSVPAQDFNGNPYQILVPGENIDKIGQGTALKLSEIENKTAAGINAAIASGEYNELVIDEDIALDGPIVGKSNFKIKGEGGVITCSTQAITATGTIGDSVGTGTYSGYTITGVSGVAVGDIIYVKGSSNLFDRASLSQIFVLGTGTAGSGYNVVYSSATAKVIQVSGTTITIDTERDWEYGQVTVYKYRPIENFHVEGLNVKYSGTDRQGTIMLKSCINSSIANCRIEQESGSAFTLQNCDSCKITGCYATIMNVYDPGASHSQDNVLRIIGSRSCEVSGCVMKNATQCIDITYQGRLDDVASNVVSKYCNINKNTVMSNYTGITLHPGTFGCNISENTLLCNTGDGVQIRGAMHSVTNNYIRCFSPDTTSYGIGFVEGCFRDSKANHNTIINFTVAIEIQEGFTETRNTSYLIQWNIEVGGNICNRCGVFFYIVRNSSSTTDTVRANSLIHDNLVLERNAIVPNAFIRATSATGKDIRYIAFLNNVIYGVTSGNVLDLDTTLSDVIFGNNNFGSSSMSRANAGSVAPVGWIEYGTTGFNLSGQSSAQSLYGGARPPVVASLGQLYYDSGTLKVWNGSEWASVTA